ncbi:MAG: sulfite exporter TauE/SafE family protein [Candidatus Saganbacteria bacterium]|nr:sulfite exporter TauE/SafE family protein [Candidatus Saganbacteria bacterium]
MTITILTMIVLTGFGAGLLSGMLGVGGGTIIVPALVIILGFSQHLAQGVSLAVIIPTAIMGAYGYSIRDKINRDVGVRMACGSVAGVLLGSYLACRIASDDLKKIFGVFAIIVALKILKDVFSK